MNIVMKRISFFALTFICTACIMSCNDKDEVKDMAADEQRSFLEDVAVEFTQKVPASDFEELKTFAEDISYIFDDYSWSTVGDTLASDFYKSMQTFEKSYVDSLTYPGRYFYGYEDYTVMILALSNFTGHFTAKDGGWVYSESKDLQFDFEDANKKACVLKIAQEGKVTELMLPEIEDEDIDEDEEEIFYYYESTSIVIGVPEKIIVSLSQEGKDMIKATFTPTITNLSEDGYFDVGKTNILMGAELALGNGYNASFKTEESPNKKISVSFDLSNKTGNLISYTLSGDPSGIPSYVLEYMADLDGLGDTIQNSEDLNTKNIYMSYSVLGKVQIIGRITDYKELMSLTELLYENSENEAKYKKNVADLNSLIDLGLYYNGSQKKQADLEFEAQLRSDTHGGKTEEWWEGIPVMVFTDGARISCEEFFDEKGFTKAIEAFDALEAQYDAMFGGEE